MSRPINLWQTDARGVAASEQPRSVGYTGPYGTHDSLRTGHLAGVPGELAAVHELHSALPATAEDEAFARRMGTSVAQGMHVSFRAAQERIIAGEVRRLPSCWVPSANIATGLVACTEDTLSPGDVLNVPEHSPRMPSQCIL